MSIFDFSPVVDVAEKLAKKTTDNVVNQDKKPSLNDLSLQIPENVVQNIRQTWNQLSAPVKQQQQASQAQASTSQQQSQPSQQPRQEQEESKVEAAVAPLANNTKPAPPRPTENEQRDQDESEIQQNIRNAVSDIVSSSVDNTKSIMKNMRVDAPVESREVKPLQTERAFVLDDDYLFKNNFKDDEDSLKPSIETNGSYKNDPEKLAELQANLESQRQRELELGKQMAISQLMNQYAAAGANPYDDPLFQQQLDSIESMTEIPSTMADAQRRFMNSDGEFETNPLKWNLFGLSSQTKTPKAAKDIYDYNFAREDANPITPHDHDKWDQRRGTWGKNMDDDDFFNRSIVDENAIDNGLSPESRESMYMTGRRYLDYVTKFGIPGRDPDLINPDAIYSKQDEMENYGFIPYIESDEALEAFHNNASANEINNFFNGVADFRRNNTGYTYKYGDQEYDGKDFDKRYSSWFSRVKNDNGKEFDDPDKVTEYSVPLTWVMHDSETGEDIVMPREGKWDWDEDGKPVYRFGGDPDDDWYFEDEDDFRNSVSYIEAGDDHPAVAWRDLEPLTLSDGRKIRADRATQIYKNKDQLADYGEGNWGKPTIEDPFKEGFLPWITDVALGSVPLFNKYSAGLQAAGNTWSNLTGFKPGSQNMNGEYRLISDDPTRSQQLISSAASAALPMTERIWGSIAGREALTKFPFWKHLEKTRPELTDNPFIQWLAGTLGEGLEEIPGNIVEEAQGTGSFLNGDYFANPMYLDENGALTKNPKLSDGSNARLAYDSQGHQIRDKDTDFFGRWNNFWKEAPLSMLGGVALGGVMGIPDAISNTRPYIQDVLDRKQERENVGYNLVIPDEVKRWEKEGE